MSETKAVLATADASRFITRLCKHWGHRFAVEFDTQRGHIDFGESECLLEGTPSALTITVTTSPEQFAQLELVVADHLQRFAREGESLVFNWQRSPAN